MPSYDVAGLRMAVDAEGEGARALLESLAPAPGAAELRLQLRGSAAFADPDRLTLQRTREALHVDGDGLRGTLGAAAGTLDARGGPDALVAALRLACAAWLGPRGGVLLHAASVEHQGRALLFAGPSGAGKSTLARRLQAHGVRVVGDEVAAVRAGRLFGHPLQRRLGDGRAPAEGLPIAAVALLSQGEPSCRELSRAEAARALLARVFLPLRDAESLAHALGAVDRLVDAAFALTLPDDDRAVHAALSLAERA